ncbi:MAG: sulfatase-like hydrolase/transferase [Anaerolineales bacterium]|nr:sulfatase-like hydrolase/transferase [Anaerolineales bacterium]
MENTINRRDFLKLTGLLPLSLVTPRFMQAPQGQKNVLVIVFDAFSAYNISLYGYSRETTPNIAKLAERSIVYNNHHAGGNFTTSGTASLLTGTHPWTHRAFELNSEVAQSVATHNIFNLFKDHYRIAYTHNSVADILLKQFQNDIDELIPRDQLLLGSYGKFIQTLFMNDEDTATVSWIRNIKSKETGYAYSLFLSHLYQPLQDNLVRNISSQFPRGIPTANYDDGFVLGQAIDEISKRLAVIPQPFLGYFHFLPPHSPYRTSLEFYNKFSKDGIEPVEKPLSAFSHKQDKFDHLRERLEYDEYILHVDEEFGRLYDHLESKGLLENTILILTSDHGELHERGINGHSTAILYEPVIHIPLLIFEPGRKTRLDINTMTSAIDLLPTLLHLTGQTIPEWAEGVILPPFAQIPEDPARKIYVMRASKNKQDQPIAVAASVTMIKGKYKIHYYMDYDDLKKNGQNELICLFDIVADPEELVDLSISHQEIADELLAELKAKLAEVNEPYL